MIGNVGVSMKIKYKIKFAKYGRICLDGITTSIKAGGNIQSVMNVSSKTISSRKITFVTDEGLSREEVIKIAIDKLYKKHGEQWEINEVAYFVSGIDKVLLM